MRTKELKRFWRTPVSHVKSLDLVSCSMTSSLEVIVLEMRDSEPFGKDVISYRFTWRNLNVFAYRVINEEQTHPGEDNLIPDDVSSWTYENSGSKWIAESNRADVGQELADLRHFVILTRDYKVEVLSDRDPKCEVI